MIKPVFEERARSKGQGKAPGGQQQVAFVKVDLGVGMGLMVAGEDGVIVTPTFGFFLDEKKVCVCVASGVVSMWLMGSTLHCLLACARFHKLKGVNAPELRTHVDLLLYQASPRRSIFRLYERRLIYHISQLTQRDIGPPAVFMQVSVLSAFDMVHDKFVSSVNGMHSLAYSSKIKVDLAQEIFPWLKKRYVEEPKATTSPAEVSAFGRTIAALVAGLPAASVFRFWSSSNQQLLESR